MDNIMKSIRFDVFLVSFTIGLLYVYLTEQYKQHIIIYPTPDNLDTYQYKDTQNKCFQYELENKNCPIFKKIHNTEL